jgi:hypothetical protein
VKQLFYGGRHGDHEAGGVGRNHHSNHCSGAMAERPAILELIEFEPLMAICTTALIACKPLPPQSELERSSNEREGRHLAHDVVWPVGRVPALASAGRD